MKAKFISVLFDFKIYFLLILLCSCLIVISTSFIPIYLGKCFNEIKIYGGEYHYSPFVFLAIFGATRAIFKLVRNQLAASLGFQVVMELRLKIVNNLIAQHSRIFYKKENIYSILTYDLNIISEILSQRTFVFIEDLAILTLSLYNLSKISITITICLLPVLLGLSLISINYAKKIQSIITKIRDSINKISLSVSYTVLGQKVIRALNAQEWIVSKYTSFSKNNLDANMELGKTNEAFVPAISFLAYFGMILCIMLALGFSMLGTFDVSNVVTINGYLWVLITAVKNLSNIIYLLVGSKESIKKILHFYDLTTKPRENEKMPTGNVSEIKLDNLSYSISGKKVMDRISLQLQRGTITIITGEIGCGKSILADIISGIEQNYEGNVFVNGIDIRDFANEYTNLIGYVLQEPVFFNLSLLENITLGRSEISKEFLDDIILKCKIDTVINKLEKGIHTIVNKDSVFLSGGEKQRICLARALICNPEVLIIDDALTALDSENLNHILPELVKLKKDMVIIIFSNQKNMLYIADKVFTLHNGSLKHGSFFGNIHNERNVSTI